MTLESCVAVCASYAYCGVYAQDCFCGASVEGTVAGKSRCAVRCPGNVDELCGGGGGNGNVLPSKAIGKKQALAGILLTVYENMFIQPQDEAVPSEIVPYIAIAAASQETVSAAPTEARGTTVVTDSAAQYVDTAGTIPSLSTSITPASQVFGVAMGGPVESSQQHITVLNSRSSYPKPFTYRSK